MFLGHIGRAARKAELPPTDSATRAEENIQVHAVPLAELDPWIDAKRKEGCLVDYKVYAALYFQRP